MRRGLLLSVVVSGVAILAAPARAQDGGRLLEGTLGPEPAPIAMEEIASGAAGPPAPGAGPAQSTQTPEIESTPLGGTGRSAFPPRPGGRAAPPTPGPSLRAGDGWWRTAGALAAIVALIFAGAAVLRKWGGAPGGLMHAIGAGGRAPSGVLSVLGRYPVGRGQTLVLLKLDRRVLLVCQSAGSRAGGMRTLCELTDPEEVASVVLFAGEAEGRTLSDRFREMVSGFERSHEDAEVVLAPRALPDRQAPRVTAGGTDPADRLHSRLDSLRRAGWGGVA
ncbi:MAG: FliO/MopB family protein [Phycisphaerales bacterium]|nr:FliO/MopB family protein [Phycisphaerales bacterium]